MKANQLSPADRAKIRKVAVALMQELLIGSSSDAEPVILNGIKNDYYWQTKHRVDRYRLSTSRAASAKAKGYYSQGVATGWHAYELAMRGQWIRAFKWAKVATGAWNNFERLDPKHYVQYVHRALVEGVLCRFADAEASLLRAAELSGHPRDFYEFQEIRGFLRKLPE